MFLLSSIKSKLVFFSVIALLAVLCSVSFSYVISVRQIKAIMRSDVESVADALQKSLNYIAATKPDAYRDESFKKEIYAIKIGKSGYPFLLDENGTLVVHHKEEGKNLAGQKHIDFIRGHKEGGTYEYTAKTTGQDKMVAFRYIEPWRLWIVPGVNEADYFAQLRSSFIKWNLVFAVIAMVLLNVVGFWITRAITVPVKEAVAVADRLAAGDLSMDIGTTASGEAGQLLLAMRHMVERLRSLVTELKSAAEKVALDASRLSATSGQLATGAEKEAAQTGSMATAGEEMAATSAEIAQNCSMASEGSRQATDAAVAGAGVVKDTLDVMNRIAERVKSSAVTVESLGARSDQIGAIIGTIEDIADQTNLLALNAAIEAARAGEQGRGFAVVADEVRALAERTTKATSEIGEMIKAVQEETKGAVMAMEEGVNEVGMGTSEAAKSGDALQEIINQINSVSMQISQIATAAEQQTATSCELSKNIQQITDVVEETARGAQDSASAAGELALLAEGLQKIVGQFKLAA